MGPAFSLSPGPANHRLDPRQKFARTEGLGHIVVRSSFEQQDLVGYLSNGTENDDRHIDRPGLNLLTDRAAGETGQHQVENYGSGSQCFTSSEPGRAFALN